MTKLKLDVKVRSQLQHLFGERELTLGASSSADTADEAHLDLLAAPTPSTCPFNNNNKTVTAYRGLP
jgi:hypothetical protein